MSKNKIGTDYKTSNTKLSEKVINGKWKKSKMTISHPRALAPNKSLPHEKAGGWAQNYTGDAC